MKWNTTIITFHSGIFSLLYMRIIYISAHIHALSLHVKVGRFIGFQYKSLLWNFIFPSKNPSGSFLPLIGQLNRFLFNVGNRFHAPKWVISLRSYPICFNVNVLKIGNVEMTWRNISKISGQGIKPTSTADCINDYIVHAQLFFPVKWIRMRTSYIAYESLNHLWNLQQSPT